jgi:hypothetical protein
MSGTPSAGTRSGPVFKRPLLSAFLPLALTLVATVNPPSAAADILPPERRTTWNPGIPGGIPARTTVCATVNASTYGNGATDATAGIQAAINACPAGQVVQLSAGDFLINGSEPITIGKSIVLRGAGPGATRLRKTSTVANPLILIGRRWLEEAESVFLTTNAAKGATSVQVASTVGFSVGQLVLVDEVTDNAYVYWGKDAAAQPGGPARGWFTRYDRPVGQMVEIASISGNTVTFTTPLHIAFDTAHDAQLTRYTIPYGAKLAGVEDLYVRGGQDDNITVRFAINGWVKNVESDWSMGDSVALDFCFRCVLRDSYMHDTPNPYPGGAGYMLSIAEYSADNLVENNIFVNGNKVMVMRASGGGNVIGYNYFDNGYIGNFLGWMETGLNASHLTCPHFELFEGNQAFNIDGDDTWGGAVYNTFFRNHATGKRRSYPDTSSRRAIGLMYGHYYYSFVGNVLGTANQNPSPFGGFAYEDLWPWENDPIGLWRIGYTPTDWDAPPDQRVVNTTHRHGNFDYATGSVHWASGFDQTLPDSLYLTGKPAFFGSNPWPWVDATGATKLFTLPARARYDAGNPNPPTATLTVTPAGTGTGTVVSSPAGINCGSACSTSFAPGTVVALTASAAAGSTFSGWGGACAGTGACQVTLNAATSVSASFALTVVNQTLTVSKAGTGAGTVTSSPAGISCGSACGASFANGTSVTLAAAPAAGSTFSGWSGACTGTGTCQVVMSAARAVTATFTATASTFTLSVSTAGTGSGSVSSSPSGISCGTACLATYASGTVVNLTATPVAGSVFAGWSGSCTGTGACQVTMSAALSVGATFNTAPPPPPPPPPTGGLVAAWGFNEGTGTTTRDASANGNTGTLVNGPTWSTGKTGGALLFDGSNDRVRVSDSNSLDLKTAATFEAWIFPTAAPSGWRTILQKEVDAYFFTASGGGNGDRPTSGGTFNGACCTFVSSTSALPANTWTHVAATYDGTRIRFYVGGVLVASQAAAGSYQVNTSPLWIGGNAVYGEHFKGKLDDVRVYNRALSAAEIQQDMASPVP